LKLVSPTPVFFINLEEDNSRRQNMIDQFDTLPTFEPRLVPAIEGKKLPNAACLRLVNNRNWIQYKGTIGCFLSHVAAWEQVAALDDQYAVVLEDDVNVSRLELLYTLEIPSDADIIFLNDRMAPSVENNSLPDVFEIWHSLKRLDEFRQGSGGDGYLLSSSGARKLLEVCANDLFYGHVDGRLLRYATSASDLAHLSDDSWIATVIREHHNPQTPPAMGVLKGYSVAPGLVRHRGIPSSREAHDRTT
jgi:GR25 family glycosyltransferase involved in LPS biosynthesis